MLELALTFPRFAGAFPNPQPDFARPGERDQIDIFVIDKVRANDRAAPVEKIQHAGRHARFLENFHEHGADIERLLGRFHDHGVACDERGGNHPAQDRHREIPRRDDEHDTARPVMLITFFAGNLLGQTWPPNQAHLMRVKVAEIDCLADVAVRFSPWFADFEDFKGGKLVAPAVENGGGAFEQLRALFK